jgi:hypothetical protein
MSRGEILRGVWFRAAAETGDCPAAARGTPDRGGGVRRSLFGLGPPSSHLVIYDKGEPLWPS